MFKTYVWDFDGTLFDTYPVMMTAVMHALDDFNIKIDRQAAYKIIKRHSIKQLVEMNGIKNEQFVQIFHHYEDLSPVTPEPYPDALETLKTIKEDGGQNYIVSHRTKRTLHELLSHSGLEQYFELVIGIDDGFVRKPDPSGINMVIAHSKSSQDQVLMIGDRPMDIQTGKNAGVKTCLVDYDLLLPDLKSDYRVTNLAEICHLDMSIHE